ncbi:hypothetical protein Tco_0753489, partial [Tanacetum coccineum]
MVLASKFSYGAGQKKFVAWTWARLLKGVDKMERLRSDGVVLEAEEERSDAEDGHHLPNSTNGWLERKKVAKKMLSSGLILQKMGGFFAELICFAARFKMLLILATQLSRLLRSLLWGIGSGLKKHLKMVWQDEDSSFPAYVYVIDVPLNVSSDNDFRTSGPDVGFGAKQPLKSPHCCDRKRPSQQPTLPNNEQISQVGSGTAPRVGYGATASEAPHCCDRKRPSQQPTLPNNEQISQ